MAFRILRDEDKVVSISFNCKKKNRESLMAIINDVIRVYEGEPVVQTEQRHDFIFHNDFFMSILVSIYNVGSGGGGIIRDRIFDISASSLASIHSCPPTL